MIDIEIRKRQRRCERIEQEREKELNKRDGE